MTSTTVTSRYGKTVTVDGNTYGDTGDVRLRIGTNPDVVLPRDVARKLAEGILAITDPPVLTILDLFNALPLGAVFQTSWDSGRVDKFDRVKLSDTLYALLNPRGSGGSYRAAGELAGTTLKRVFV